MRVILDYRESKLQMLIQSLFDQSKAAEMKHIHFLVENLSIGDICLSNQEGEEIIIERKSVSDLLSSITDGRYREQSLRLGAERIHNHHIIYLIEGSIESFRRYSHKSGEQRLQQIERDRVSLYSAVFSLYYYKGFSVMFSESLQHTAQLVYQFSLKMVRSMNKYRPYYSQLPPIPQTIRPNSLPSSILDSPSDTPQEEKTSVSQDNNGNDENNGNESSTQHHTPTNEANMDYLSCIKTEKKDNITRDNIWHIMLMQIPYVSEKVACALIDKYHSVPDLVFALQQDPMCLDGFKMIDANGKSRKLSSKVIHYLQELLL